MPKRSNSRRIEARKNRHYNENARISLMREEDILAFLAEIEDPFVLALDRIQDPHNLGACLRSANAAGVDLVIAPLDRAVGLTDTARRVACGAAEKTPYVRVGNLGRTLDALKEAAFWLVGTSDKAEMDVFDAQFSGPICLVVGSEETGIRAKTASKCDQLVSIPMMGDVECLNASVACGICLFEAVRQRHSGG